VLIVRDAQMKALHAGAHQQRVDALVAEIRGDFPDAAREAGDGEIRAAIDQASAAAPALGFESWAAVAMLAKVTFLLNDAPWAAPELGALGAILEDTGYATEAEKMQAFVDAVAAHVDGMTDPAPAERL